MKWFPPHYYLNSNRALAIAWNDCSILSTAMPTGLTPARAWNRMQTCNMQSLVAASSASAYTGGRSRRSPNPCHSGLCAAKSSMLSRPAHANLF